MSGVVPGGPGLVAVGYQLGGFPTCTGMGPFVLVSTCDGPRDAVAWTSRDGRHWDLVASPASFNGYLIDRPSTGSAGLIAPGHAAFGPMATVIWATPDGLRWQRRSSSSFKDGGITGLAPIGSGSVAVGQGGFATHRFVARAWDSANGQVWSKANVEAGGDLMTGVATSAHGLVAVGETPAGGGIAWTSADGLSWKAATISHAAALTVVAAVPGGVVAAGGDGIWELPDGQPWRHALVVAGVTFAAIITSSARTLVIGTRGDQPLAEEVVAWEGPPDIAP